jgi:signal transduction histidine kinase
MRGEYWSGCAAWPGWRNWRPHRGTRDRSCWRTPAALAEKGLGPALRALGRRSPIPVDLRVQVNERLPEPVEISAYYVIAEALTNAVKHARASTLGGRIFLDSPPGGGTSLRAELPLTAPARGRLSR